MELNLPDKAKCHVVRKIMVGLKKVHYFDFSMRKKSETIDYAFVVFNSINKNGLDLVNYCVFQIICTIFVNVD